MKKICLIMASLAFLSFAGCDFIHIEKIAALGPIKYTGNDKALLVGINAYPGAPLNGCVNDVNDMKAYLMAYQGFREDQIKLIIDKDATTNNILLALKWLTEDAKNGDRRLFHFSGHGAEYPGGFDAINQPDGLNQIVCPVDFDWTEKHMITDAQFKWIFGKMPKGVIFNWVSDSCHSGDLIKSPRILSKQYPYVPAQITVQIQMAGQWYNLKGYKIRSFTDGLLDVGFISGSQYDQTSADAYINLKFHGALTYYLLEALKSMPNKPIKDVVLKTRELLKQNKYTQIPQFEGSRVNEPFLR